MMFCKFDDTVNCEAYCPEDGCCEDCTMYPYNKKSYDCWKPEWADKEPCPLVTGEYGTCARCEWAHERESD